MTTKLLNRKKMRKKWTIGIVLLTVMALLPCFYLLYKNCNYPVEMYLEPLEIEYDFTKPGITLEEVQELNDNQAEIKYQKDSKKVYSIDGKIANRKICSLEDALSVLYDYRDIMGIREYDYAVYLIEEENLDYYILKQLHEGIIVNSYSFTIVTTKDGAGIRIAGKYLNVSGMRTDVFLSYKECWKINKDFFKGIRKEKVKLLICKFKGSAELCWQYDVSDKHGRNRQTVYVSALDGDIVWISADGTA